MKVRCCFCDGITPDVQPYTLAECYHCKKPIRVLHRVSVERMELSETAKTRRKIPNYLELE